MESDSHHNPLAREVIAAIDDNDTDRVKDVLCRNASIADPKWRSGYKPSKYNGAYQLVK